MSEFVQIDAPALEDVSPGSVRHRFTRKLIERLSANLPHGQLVFHLPDGSRVATAGQHPGPEARVSIRHSRVARRVLFSGALGMADSYIDGDWHTDDLTSVIEFGATNVDGFDSAVKPLSGLRALTRLHHRVRENTRRGSRRNIAAHYDLGNEFYAAWLDGGMTYSSARFSDPSESLEVAQARKFARLARELDLRPGEHILEIGCGWGSFAIFAARRYGCRVTALTVSPSQAEWARARVTEAGLDGQIDIRLQDYRDVEGTFDKIASIEMFEAVGEKYWPAFFETLSARLRAGGRAALQVITIDEARYDAYRRNPDFIQLRVFPGGMLPSPTALSQAAKRLGLAVTKAEMFGGDYAETLRRWRQSFEIAWPDLAEMGFDEKFRRLWRYYLCYCEAGFRAGNISVGQFTLERS